MKLMKYMTKTRLSVVLTALLLSGSVASAQMNNPQDSVALRETPGAVDMSPTLQAIQNATYADREELFPGLESRVKAAETILAKLTLPDSAKDDVKKVTDALTAAIGKARGAVAADWERVRSELKDSFAAYAETVIRAEQSASLAGK